MIINCPNCEKNFQVEDALLEGKKEQKLKCSACQHVWVHDLEEKKQAPEAKEAPKAPISPEKPTVQVQKLPPHHRKLMWSLYLLITLLVTVPMLILMRYHVVAAIPQTEPLYEALGLPVNTRIEHFSFKDVSFSKLDTDEGDKLIIRGKIQYQPEQQEARTVPHVKVTVYGKADCEKQTWWQRKRFGRDLFQEKGLCKIDSWSFSTKDNLALPGEVIKFEKEKLYLNEEIIPVEVNLQFVENPHVPGVGH